MGIIQNDGTMTQGLPLTVAISALRLEDLVLRHHEEMPTWVFAGIYAHPSLYRLDSNGAPAVLIANCRDELVLMSGLGKQRFLGVLSDMKPASFFDFENGKVAICPDCCSKIIKPRFESTSPH